MDPGAIDQVRLNFNPQGLFVINAAIGLMMFGVALELKVEDFKRVLIAPKAPVIGLGAQFILLPSFTYLLTLVLRPPPSMALGMILVAACPGGNLSNIITFLARGNCAVSVSMTAVSTAAAIFLTPLNLALWGSLNSRTAAILKAVHLSPFDVFINIFIILGIPLISGLLIARSLPQLVGKVRKPFKIFSLAFFLAIVGAALAANWQHFLNYVGFVFFGVLIHNALALNIGYWSARLLGLGEADNRAVSIEVGIQNSGLGLVLVFTFFEGMGGMAIITAWWGIWHIIAGLTAAFIFSRRALPETTV
jgi:BASS family bile acid:Na+ symporter